MTTRRVLPLLVVLVSPIVARGDTVAISGQTTVPVYKLVKLSVPLPAGAAAVWDVFPESLSAGNLPDIVETSSPTEAFLVFTGPPGKYLVKARVVKSVNNVISIDSGQVLVVIGPGQPGPTPPQPTPPQPTPPTVPAELMSRLQTAYNADPTPTKAADVKMLAAAFRSAATTTPDPAFKVRADLVGWAQRNTANAMMDPPNPTPQTIKIYTVRRAAGDWLNEKVGTGAQDVLTAELRNRYVAEYTNVANGLDQLK